MSERRNITVYKNGKVYEEEWDTSLNSKGMNICDNIVSSIEKKTDLEIKIEDLEAEIVDLKKRIDNLEKT